MTTTTLQHRLTLPREELERLVQYLADKYPATFFTDPRMKRPLKKNILLDLARDDVLDDDSRESALTFYTKDWNYERSLQAGTRRVDLDGKEVGTVTEQEQRDAQKRVQLQKQELHERQAQTQDPVAIVRKLHDEGRISTDQLNKIDAPTLSKTPTPTRPPTMKPKNNPPENSPELARLRALLANIDGILAGIEDAPLRSALTTAALKVLVDEATKVMTLLEGEHAGELELTA